MVAEVEEVEAEEETIVKTEMVVEDEDEDEDDEEANVEKLEEAVAVVKVTEGEEGRTSVKISEVFDLVFT